MRGGYPHKHPSSLTTPRIDFILGVLVLGMIIHDEVGRTHSLIGVDDLLVVVQGASSARLADDLQIVTRGI